MFCLIFSYFSIFREFSPKTISVLRMVEYSAILVLYYFEDTLANVGLPDDWLEW